MEAVALPLFAPDDTIENALQRLSEQQRTTLVLRDVDGLWLIFAGRLLDARDAGKIALSEVAEREQLDRSAVTSTGIGLELAADGPPETLAFEQPMTEVSAAISSLVFDQLVRVDGAGSIVPVVASELPTEQNGGITRERVTFHLQPSLKWHDGTACTSLDVAASWATFVNQNSLESNVDLNDVVEQVETPDEATVSFRLPRALSPGGRGVFASALRTMQVQPAGFHAEVPVGTGPFKVVNWEPKQYIELAVNADYPFAATLLDRIVIEAPTHDASLAPLRALDVDTILQAAPNLYNCFAPKPRRVMGSFLSDIFRPDTYRPDSDTRRGIVRVFRRPYLTAATGPQMISVAPMTADQAAIFDTPRSLRCDGPERRRYPDPPATDGQRCNSCSMRGDRGTIWWE